MTGSSSSLLARAALAVVLCACMLGIGGTAKRGAEGGFPEDAPDVVIFLRVFGQMPREGANADVVDERAVNAFRRLSSEIKDGVTIRHALPMLLATIDKGARAQFGDVGMVTFSIRRESPDQAAIDRDGTSSVTETGESRERPTAGGRGVWSAHRLAVEKAWPEGLPFDPAFEIGFNLNALRRQAPEFSSRADVLGALHAMGIANAREVMLHGRLIRPEHVRLNDAKGLAEKYRGPALLAIEVTWSARSTPPGTVKRATIGAPFWPANEAGVQPPTGAACVCAIRADFGGAGTASAGGGLGPWVRIGCEAAAAINGGRGSAGVAAQMESLAEWQRRHGGLVRRVVNAAGRWMVVAARAGDKEGDTAGGWVSAVIPMRNRNASDEPATALGSLAKVMGLQGETLPVAGSSGASLRATMTCEVPGTLGIDVIGIGVIGGQGAGSLAAVAWSGGGDRGERAAAKVRERLERVKGELVK